MTGLFDDPAVAGTEFFRLDRAPPRRRRRDRLVGDGILRSPVSSTYCCVRSGRDAASHRPSASPRISSPPRSAISPTGSPQPTNRSACWPASPSRTSTQCSWPRCWIAPRGARLAASSTAITTRSLLGPSSATRAAKGLDIGEPVLITELTTIPVVDGPGSHDWRAPEDHPRFGTIRWSGRNPNPLYFLNVRVLEAFTLRIHIAAFADTTVSSALKIRINDVYVDFTIEADDAKLWDQHPPGGSAAAGGWAGNRV